MSKDKGIITAQQFVDELRRYQKGSVTRRHFLGVTGLGVATAALSGAMPGLKPRKAYAALSGTVNFTTWRCANTSSMLPSGGIRWLSRPGRSRISG